MSSGWERGTGALEILKKLFYFREFINKFNSIFIIFNINFINIMQNHKICLNISSTTLRLPSFILSPSIRLFISDKTFSLFHKMFSHDMKNLVWSVAELTFLSTSAMKMFFRDVTTWMRKISWKRSDSEWREHWMSGEMTNWGKIQTISEARHKKRHLLACDDNRESFLFSFTSLRVFHLLSWALIGDDDGTKLE